MVLIKPTSAALHLLAIVSSLQGVLSAPVTERAVARTSPPAGCLTVSKGPRAGEYGTLSAAVAAVKANGCIFIYDGTYTEQVYIRVANLTLYGYTTDTGSYRNNAATITNSLGSAQAGSLDASSTVNVVGADFKAYNINFENSYGTAGQAVALTANGQRQGFYGCKFLGFQDTLYAKHGWQYYSNCYMEGAVDFIFGNAAAWFGECTIAASRGGYITASSRTLADDPSWYVFDRSVITAAPGASVNGLVFLGRPWRPNARVMYQNSVLTEVVHPAGYAPMAADATPTFTEYKNTGAGASTAARKYFTPARGPVSKDWLWPGAGRWWDQSY